MGPPRATAWVCLCVSACVCPGHDQRNGSIRVNWMIYIATILPGILSLDLYLFCSLLPLGHSPRHPHLLMSLLPGLPQQQWNFPTHYPIRTFPPNCETREIHSTLQSDYFLENMKKQEKSDKGWGGGTLAPHSYLAHCTQCNPLHDLIQAAAQHVWTCCVL